MATANYTAGSWLGVLRSRTAVFLGPGTPPALVQSLWDLLGEAPEVHEVLHAVTSSFGVSLAKIPSFGIVDFRDALRVFLRGDLDLTVQLPGGPVELNGRDVTTWTERRFDLPEWYRLTVAGGTQPGTVLPLTEGVVLLQSLTVAVTGAPAAAREIIAGSGATEREVSAETVLGLTDDDSHYAAETAEPGQEAQGEPSPDVESVAPADQMPAHELTGTYDHLWEKTVIRSIEDAAVRDEPEESEAGAPHPAAPETDAGPDLPAPATPPPATPLPATPTPATPPPAAVPAPGPAGGLIDSVPWRTGGSSVPAVQVQPPFDLPQVPVPASGPAVDPEEFAGDHDGQTIMKSDLAGMGAHPEPVQEPVSGAGLLVLALVCDRGHANPPTHAQCAACGSPLPPDAVRVARPRLGRMRVSTGELVDLDQSLVIGRQPSVSRVQGGVMPRLVQVSSPGGDISRSHVEVRLEGWHVMLCDLKATNGTVLVREGQQPRRLAQNEMAILLDGDIAELGDDISLRFEEIL
ncbi:hypothetical protein GCM10009712_08010 [Pseudarthrobacter sulfonivorans]|uniref:FHA domain-containing protein n=1 Tax=Pseudarthrobacter sulfonivorans TaxID=121292 RepID=UPI00168AC51B|nr:FHA domain-containing protein [Pseudarthrobacter sulfonivorans]